MSSKPTTAQSTASRGRSKSVEPREKRPVQEVRAEIRSYIRNERDTILKKWLALKESIRSEDHRRDQFLDRKLKEDTKSLPMHVLKFIGTLKKAVRNTMRYKGGTPYSIIRSLFLYWDADKSGRISRDELMCCMKSLGVKVTLEDCEGIVNYYAGLADKLAPKGSGGETEMDYQDLLQDVLSGEPSVIAFVSQSEDDERDANEIRFEEVADKWVSMPLIVVKFIEAVRLYLTRTMQRDGGTPHQHVRYLFQFYDYDYSNGLAPDELLLACQRRMNMACTLDQAKEIVEYYDRKGQGEVSPEQFISDVCNDVKPILHFTELTPRQRANAHRSLASNPFIPKPFHAPPNKVLEKFKQDCKKALVNKVNKMGGTVASWIREAFVYWDPHYTRKIREWEALQGAALRLGVHITEDESKALMKCYDRYNTGEMHYTYLSEEIMKEDPHFLMDSKLADPNFSTTSRCPPMVQKVLENIRTAVDKFTSRSKGSLSGRDVLHGTCLKYDADKTGHIDLHGFKKTVGDLKVRNVNESELQLAMKWFDTNGSQCCDYNAMIRQMFRGQGDVLTDPLVLPRIRESTSINYKPEMLGSSGIAMMKSRSLSSSTGSMPTLKATKSRNILSGPFKTLADKETFGVKSSILEKNLEIVESQAVKNARAKMRRNKIIAERVKVEQKLASIEEQKKKIIEEFKARRGK